MFLILANYCFIQKIAVYSKIECDTSCRFTQRIDIRLIYFCFQGEKGERGVEGIEGLRVS